VKFKDYDQGPHTAGTDGGMNPDAYYMLKKSRYIEDNFLLFSNLIRRKKLLKRMKLDIIYRAIRSNFINLINKFQRKKKVVLKEF
jgi:hypothetical protein